MTTIKRERRLYRYVIDHDCGFAPNPFGGFCTLACCKPKIRKGAAAGDLIIGFGPAKYKMSGKMIYWMEIDEVLSFDEYWLDERFQSKKPQLSGSIRSFFGDNIYRSEVSSDESERPDERHWIQAKSFHSDIKSSLGKGNLKRDTGSTDQVLIGQNYAYWGRDAISLPEHFSSVVKKGRGHVYKDLNNELRDEVISWLKGMNERGFLGEPTDWTRSPLVRDALQISQAA